MMSNKEFYSCVRWNLPTAKKVILVSNKHLKTNMVEKIIQSYHTFLEDYGDPRVKDWFGMSSPLPTIGLSLTYVFIVKVNIQISQ
jgi:hypothetical protein